MPPFHFLSSYTTYHPLFLPFRPSRSNIAHVETLRCTSQCADNVCTLPCPLSATSGSECNTLGSPFSGLRARNSQLGVLHLRCSPRARFSSLLFVFCCEHLILNATGKLCPHIKLTLLVFGATKRPRSGAKNRRLLAVPTFRYPVTKT